MTRLADTPTLREQAPLPSETVIHVSPTGRSVRAYVDGDEV